MTQNPRSLYARTLAAGGGTFVMHAENFERADIVDGFAVAMVDGTYRKVHVNDQVNFNRAISQVIEDYPMAGAIGTWVDGDFIHIDPVRVTATEAEARHLAAFFNQEAYYILHEQREVRL